MAKAKSAKTNDTSANLGFEAKLWLAADKLRNNGALNKSYVCVECENGALPGQLFTGLVRSVVK